jgi:hypothetical protein
MEEEAEAGRTSRPVKALRISMSVGEMATAITEPR